MMIPEAIRQFQHEVGSLGCEDPLTSSPENVSSKVFDNMMRRRLDYSLITLGQEVQGIVTNRDLLRTIAQRKGSEPPIYMIGLPEDFFEAETAKKKFGNAVRSLRRGYTNILEARSTIKRSQRRPSQKKNYYEVDVSIRMVDGLPSIHELGWDLPRIYDRISDHLKRKQTKKWKRRRKRQSHSPSAIATPINSPTAKDRARE